MTVPASESVAPVHRHIVGTAVLVGAVAFLAGWIIPAVFMKSNLAPLSGIVFGGPIGTIAGVVFGVVTARRKFERTEPRVLLGWLLGAWASTLLYTLLTSFLAARLMIPAIGLQLFVLSGSAITLFSHPIRRSLPTSTSRWCSILFLLMVAALATSAFLPVRPSAATALATPLSLAFVLDQRLDSAHHLPALVISKPALLIEWIVVITAAMIAGFRIGAAGRGKSNA